MNSSTTSLIRKLGLEPDPWQIEVLDSTHPRLLVNCCRQAGKSTTAALLAVAKAVLEPSTSVLLVSRRRWHSAELGRIVTDLLAHLPVTDVIHKSSDELLFANHSRIVTFPGREEAIRGSSNVGLLIVDEAARVADELYGTARRMLAMSHGRLICLSTPYGEGGFFWDAWSRGGDHWKRIEVPAERIARISPAFLEQERRILGESFFRQEYGCVAAPLELAA
jgi:hypothetical protein